MKWIAAAILLANSAFATTLVSDTFDGSGSTGAALGLFAVSWTQTGSWTNIAIGANLVSSSSGSAGTGTAYLMDQIGPGTTAADDVASPFVFSILGNPGINVMLPLFNALTLGPGTYYLVITESSGSPSPVYWDITTAPDQVSASGVTQNPNLSSGSPDSFPPASTFSTVAFAPIFTVTGDPAVGAVPEPSTTTMMLIGLTAVIAGCWKRRRISGTTRRVSTVHITVNAT